VKNEEVTGGRVGVKNKKGKWRWKAKGSRYTSAAMGEGRNREAQKNKPTKKRRGKKDIDNQYIGKGESTKWNLQRSKHVRGRKP